MDDLKREQLKSQALLDRVADITRMYEAGLADARIAVTELAGENEELKKRVQELEAAEEVKDVAKGNTKAKPAA